MEVDEDEGARKKRKAPSGGFQVHQDRVARARTHPLRQDENGNGQGREEADYEDVEADIDLSEYDCPPFYCNFLSR